MKNTGIFSISKISDYYFINSLEKLLNVKFPPSVITTEDALYEAVWTLGKLSLPLATTGDNYMVVKEKLSPVASFCTHGIKSDYSKCKLFDILDSFSTDPDICFIMHDSAFTVPNNLFIITNGTKWKQYIINDDAFIATCVFSQDSSKCDSLVIKQLISLKSFVRYDS